MAMWGTNKRIQDLEGLVDHLKLHNRLLGKILEESRQTNSKIMTDMLSGIQEDEIDSVIDSYGKIIYISPPILKALGYNLSDIQMRNYMELISGNNQDKEKLRRKLRLPRKQKFNLLLSGNSNRKKTPEIYVEVTKTPQFQYVGSLGYASRRAYRVHGATFVKIKRLRKPKREPDIKNEIRKLEIQKRTDQLTKQINDQRS